MTSKDKNTIHSWDYRTTEIDTDGGSLTLVFDDLEEQEQVLVFTQHVALGFYKGFGDKLPGRVYLNDFLVRKRSTQESTLLRYLEESLLQDENFSARDVLLQKIEFVRSDLFADNIPMSWTVTEVRRKYVESIVIGETYQLNTVEEKYVSLKNDEMTTDEFEAWVYENQEVVERSYSASVYDDLIILDYSDREAKAELLKVLEIDFRKLKLISVYNSICRILESSCEIEDLSCRDSIEYFNYVFEFRINGIVVGILNPLKLVSAEADETARVAEFSERFRNPRHFFELLKSELNTENIRVVIEEEISEMHFDHHSEGYSGTEEEMYIDMDSHRLIMNKEFVRTKMIDYWL